MLTKKKRNIKNKNKKTLKKQIKHQPQYDYIILGGGIGGLYTIYKLSQQYPNKTFLLLEKSKRLGGRVHSVQLHPTNDPEYLLEAGAGRFSQHHPILKSLITEFGLESNIMPSSANAEYYPIQPKKTPSPSPTKSKSIFSQVADVVQTSILGESELEKLVIRVVLASKVQSREYLQKRNFITYAKTILTTQEVETIIESFGYYSELVIMNAYDAIQLMQQLGPNNTFYTLKGGLNQIIDHLVERIQQQNNTNLQLYQEVVSILPITNIKHTTKQYHIRTKTNQFLARNVICALPKQHLEKLRIFETIRPILSKILCGKLCRIYARFHPNAELWFKDLPKITTNNNLRMVIPTNVKKGLIMISYSDNKYAEFWYRIYQKGKKPLIKELRKEILQTTGKTIPEPMEIHVFYWPCGVGYWAINANSAEISQKMIQPLTKYPNIYCCGEHFSEKNQQWMEGALETSQKVIDHITTNPQ